MLAFVNYCVAMVGNFTSYFAIDTIGRRPLYVYGSLGLVVANLLVGFMSLVQGSNPVASGNVAVFGLSLWSFIYQSCVGTTAWAINGEVPSNRLRTKTNAWVNSVNALVSFGISYAIPPLFQPDGANLGLRWAISLEDVRFYSSSSRSSHYQKPRAGRLGSLTECLKPKFRRENLSKPSSTPMETWFCRGSRKKIRAGYNLNVPAGMVQALSYDGFCTYCKRNHDASVRPTGSGRDQDQK